VHYINLQSCSCDISWTNKLMMMMMMKNVFLGWGPGNRRFKPKLQNFQMTIYRKVVGLMRLGAMNLQGIEFARKGGGNCKERNVQGKTPQVASVWICKEWIYPGNQEVESARNSICKERNLQGTELARNGGGICKEWTLQECGLCVHHSSVGSSIWPAIPVYAMWECESSGCF